MQYRYYSVELAFFLHFFRVLKIGYKLFFVTRTRYCNSIKKKKTIVKYQEKHFGLNSLLLARIRNVNAPYSYKCYLQILDLPFRWNCTTLDRRSYHGIGTLLVQQVSLYDPFDVLFGDI